MLPIQISLFTELIIAHKGEDFGKQGGVIFIDTTSDFPFDNQWFTFKAYVLQNSFKIPGIPTSFLKEHCSLIPDLEKYTLKQVLERPKRKKKTQFSLAKLNNTTRLQQIVIKSADTNTITWSLQRGSTPNTVSQKNLLKYLFLNAFSKFKSSTER